MYRVRVNRGLYDTLLSQRNRPWSFWDVFAALMVILLFGLVISIVWNVFGNPCRKFLTIIKLCIAIYIVVMMWLAAQALAAHEEDRQFFLHRFIFMVFFSVIGSLILFVLMVIAAGYRSGHEVSGLGYPEYILRDYNSLLIPQVSNSQNWKRYKRCIVKSGVCDELSKQFETLEDNTIWLTPIESGCCRPPSMCGYPAVNASFYDLNVKPAGQSKECKTYKNSPDIKCYDCDSCKAGVLQNIKTDILLELLWVMFLPCFLLVFSLFALACSDADKIKPIVFGLAIGLSQQVVNIISIFILLAAAWWFAGVLVIMLDKSNMIAKSTFNVP